MTELELIGKSAKESVGALLDLSEETINLALKLTAKKIREKAAYLKEQNAIDIEAAVKKGKPEGFIDRLLLSTKVIEGVATGIEQVALLNSPVGEEVYSFTNKEQGIKIVQKRVPFGVVGMIYEARPNVTADAFALCFKTRNAVILKGGSDAINSNKAMVCVIKSALKECGVNENAVNLIEDTSRETTLAFMKMNGYLDLLIPRGGASLIKSALQEATVPIIETGTGNCHVYVDEFANPQMAADVIFNAKTQRYSVCNACESLVIHSKILASVLPLIKNKLSEKNVEIRSDERAQKVIGGVLATEEDFYTEYGGPVISVKTVDSLDEAIKHINQHSTHHSEAIITENKDNADKFTRLIDSSSVYVNASTRFTDGFVFGLGAEIGIATQKLHARGPMGLKALTTTKFIVNGNGAVRK